MKHINLKNHYVEIYDDIECLPIVRFHKYNKMLLVDAGCGSDMTDIDSHISRAIAYSNRHQTKEAATELENLRQNLYFVQMNLSPKFMAFAVLVKSIDGEDCTDLSDEGLKAVLAKLGDVPVKDLTSSLEEVKKKITQQLNSYFPSLFDDMREKEYNDILRERTMRILRGIIHRKKEDISNITDELIVFFKPQKFTGSDSSEIRQDKQFEDMCLVLSRQYHCEPKKMTTLEFYNAFEFLRKEQKEQKNMKKYGR